MADRQLFPEWRDAASTTKYPFGDESSLVNDEGYALLEGTFLDAAIYPVGGGHGLHLSSVEVTHSSVTVTVGDRANKALASASFDVVDPPALLSLQDAHGRPAGVLVSSPERLAVFQSWEVGVHKFKLAQSQFAASCCMPTPEAGVRGIVLEDGTVFTGDVWLVGDDGVVVRGESLTVEDEFESKTYAVLRFDAVGDPLFRRKLCEEEGLFESPRFVREVRVVHAGGEFSCSPGGDLKLVAHNGLAEDSVLRIRPGPSGLTITLAGAGE